MSEIKKTKRDRSFGSGLAVRRQSDAPMKRRINEWF
jgi:hypothetical protein